MSLAAATQRFFRWCGLNLTRLPGNRFDAMPDVLQRLAHLGFEPTLIIDVGANRGQWATVVSGVFPHVPLHMIEPQVACQADLAALVARRGAAHVHQALVTKPGVSQVQMVGGGTGGSGAHVIDTTTGRTDGQSMLSTTLDTLLAARLGAADRVLLKLDVEGHEVDVLSGAQAILPHVDVIVSEVLFYDVDRAGNLTFLNYMSALDAEGFELYDFAALGSRARDGRLRVGDAIFVRRGGTLAADDGWA
jgi:FkbM family methyltransferase